MDPSRSVKEAIAKIRNQLVVNLTYISERDRETLAILQTHIEDQLREIERLTDTV